ncbi:RES family NAD+ phosphorylase [Arenibacter sp. F26102]|uniref:RES family NAD+ phosphorylase n=1 Tax=Arenibacter sp. F26102 TaxID=2926416 RepID=UPI001FF46FD8|nr:RES family NAD+ phosphorylase [Arenibacter sp. F26102]MCK0145821.1 RES family NAD+ phosphorylase [Arenibacter sp. F26102]
MKLYRFSNIKYAQLIDGNGASINSGRWNSLNVPMIYASSTASLAFLELLRRFKPRHIPINFCLIEYALDDKVSILEITAKELPVNWDSPIHNDKTQLIGDKFIRDNKHLLLKVPSVLLPSEYHYNINPLHPDIKKLSINEIVKTPINLKLFAK